MVEIKWNCHSSLSFFPPKLPLEGLPCSQSVTLKLWPVSYSIFCIYIRLSLFFFSFNVSRFTPPKSHSVLTLNPAPRASTKPTSWGSWKGSVNQIHVLPASFRREVAGWVAGAAGGWLLGTGGRLVHFSSYWVSCCGSLSPRMVTASKNAFAAVAAWAGFKCSPCLSAGMEKWLRCAKTQQECPALGCWWGQAGCR